MRSQHHSLAIQHVRLHVVQRSAVLADTDIRLTVKTQPVSVRRSCACSKYCRMTTDIFALYHMAAC